MFIPFGQWAPDQPALNGQAQVALNCMGQDGYYKPFKQIGDVTGSIDNKALGAISFANNTGLTFTFVGDKTKLYKFNVNTFDDVSKSGGYNDLGDNRWNFVEFGSKAIATSYVNDVQVYDTASDVLFSDLAGSPPRAKHIAVVGDFVVLANLTSDAVFNTNESALRWSAINDPTDWTPSVSTQSDGQILENGDGGEIQGITGNSTYGLIIQERAIQRMNYIGSPLVFSFEVVDRNRGTSIPNSIVSLGKNTYFIGTDGFYSFDGINLVNIGNGKVNNWFYDNFDILYKNNVSASIDPINTLIMWAFTSKTAENTSYADKIICYNWESGQFSLIDLTVDLIFPALTEGYTLEELDNINANLDLFPLSLDSDAWKGGATLTGVFNSSQAFGYFDGDAMEATIETTEFQGSEGRFSHINKVTPMVEGDQSTQITIKMGSRNTRTESTTYGVDVALDSLGRANVRQNAVFHRCQVKLANGFEKANGVQIDDEFIKIGAKR